MCYHFWFTSFETTEHLRGFQLATLTIMALPPWASKLIWGLCQFLSRFIPVVNSGTEEITEE
jgi:hypothetical protein